LRIKEQHIRFAGIPILGTVLGYLLCPNDTIRVYHILKSIIFTLFFWQGFFFITSFFRKQYPLIKHTQKRLALTLCVSSFYIFISDFILRYFLNLFYPELASPIDSLLNHFLVNFSISILVGMIYELTYFFSNWNLSTIEAEKLKADQTIAQLDSLKNQISPHFLFNSLNTLVALISENQKQAIDFTHKLAEVYRYILEYKEKELVSLATELDFIYAYVFLLKIRYPENLTVYFNINEAHLKYLVAPLSIQMLIENALKHNIISKKYPLNIEIYTEKGEVIIVKNKLQLKTAIEKSTKTGLDNIRKRYQFLSNKSIDVIATKACFIVVIPLLKTIERP
jgi:hypothetical protein